VTAREQFQAHTVINRDNQHSNYGRTPEGAEDLMRQNLEYLKDFTAALDQLRQRQAAFLAEHPPFGSRYS